MKLLSRIFIATLFFNISCIAQESGIDYQTIVQPCVAMWDQQYISTLPIEEITTIADMLLLSYQVVQSSVNMSQARLIMQAELFNIVTLSINDTFDARMQAQNNDLTTIKLAITHIEQAQEQIKFACNTLKKFGPALIHIDPIIIQTFISNLKNVILQWAKNQHDTMQQLTTLPDQFHAICNLLGNVETTFNTMVATDSIEHSQLLRGTNNLIDMYNNIENVLANITAIRQESLANFSSILTLFFKNHYQVLYNHLQTVDASNLKFSYSSSNTLPDPEQVFSYA